MIRRTTLRSTLAAGMLAALALTSACGPTGATAESADVPPVATTTGPTTPSSTAPSSASASPLEPAPGSASPSTAPASPSASASPSAKPSKAAPKPPSYDVKATQTKLAALHYYAGPVDGQIGGAMHSAVMAFQKVQGLSADGAVGPSTLAALASPKAPGYPSSGKADRVEVDLSKQVLYVIHGGHLARVMPVSSGSGKKYTSGGSIATALTPVGYFTVGRRIVGERHAKLGVLYDPNYFYRGWAIHGSNSVPAYPASHGCVRVSRADGTYLLGAIHVGTQVHLYGGSYTFTAGSSAPGTNDPGGDTGADASPTPSPAAPSPATTSPAPAPTTATTSPSQKPSPKPSITSPAPTPTSSSPKPTSPTTSPSPSAAATASPSSSASAGATGSPTASASGTAASKA